MTHLGNSFPGNESIETDGATPDDLTQHDGKRRPVHRDERVYVQFRGSELFEWAITAGDLDWVHRGCCSDIMAYKLVNAHG